MNDDDEHSVVVNIPQRYPREGHHSSAVHEDR